MENKPITKLTSGNERTSMYRNKPSIELEELIDIAYDLKLVICFIFYIKIIYE